MPTFRVFRFGDAAVVLEFETGSADEINEYVMFVSACVRAQSHTGVLDVVEGLRTVTIVFDPLKTDVQKVVTVLEDTAETQAFIDKAGRELTVPVCYGGVYGPDLSEVAKYSCCSEEELITRHQKAIYRVYMVGFLPGFPYMGSGDSKILAPRKEVPRVRVEKGSVGIAEKYTGVYPIDSPGGWQIIGRCPVELFDIDASDPFFFHVGDNVKFKAVTEDEYCSLRQIK